MSGSRYVNRTPSLHVSDSQSTLPRIEVNEPPTVSVVTPSFNMARFLEATIESVLSQSYPHIDYIVMDGGSTDGTLSILKKYEGCLRYVSEPDRGQCDAINQGFEVTKGSIFAFLNADDLYCPGAIEAVVRAFRENPTAGVVYGDGDHIDEAGALIGPYPTWDFDPALLAQRCFICQPAGFMRREVFADIGKMNQDLHFALDYDLWIRASKKCRFHRVPETLAQSRMYRANKTLRNRIETFRDTVRVLKRHFHYVPYDTTYGYAGAIVDRRDGFFEPIPPSSTIYLLAVVLGLYENPTQPVRFLREAAQHTRLGRLFSSGRKHTPC